MLYALCDDFRCWNGYGRHKLLITKLETILYCGVKQALVYDNLIQEP